MVPSAPVDPLCSPPKRAYLQSRWAKLGLAVLAPVVFFVLLEAGLRIGGFGRDVRFFIPDTEPGVYRTNPGFTALFFPATFGLKPVNFRISRHKPAGTVRVFVLGESAALGVPEPAFGLAPQLQAQLRAVRPGAKIEVYNLGIAGINSYVIVEIARQVVDFEPDLLVIYMGNNEVIGPFGASSVVNEGTPPHFVVRATVFVRSTRTGQLFTQIIRALRGSGNDFRELGDGRMFAGKVVPTGDPRLARIRRSFAANLDEILSFAARRGVKTVLSTVAVNVRDSSPFASVPADPPAALVEADRALELGKDDEIRGLLEKAVAAEPGHAEAQFRLARLLEQQGDVAAARSHYFDALEHDALRFRTDAELNALTRKAARAHPDLVTLVDASRELGSDPASTAPLAGREFFFEHVHLTWEGNYALARLLAGTAAQVLWGVDARSAPWLDSGTCARAVGFTPVGRLAQLQTTKELTSRPPFTGQWLFPQDCARLKGEIDEVGATLSRPGGIRIAVAAIDRALAGDPDNPVLAFQAAAVHLQAGDPRGALALNDRCATLVPPSGELAAQRAYLLQELGRGGEAAAILQESMAREPYYFQTYPLLAEIWVANRKVTQAVSEMGKLAARMPGCGVVCRTYAQLLVQTGDWSGAEREWSRLLLIRPDDEIVLAPFVERLFKTDRADRAIDLMLRAYAFNSWSYPNDERLAQVFSDKGDTARSVEFLKALAASGPVNARFHIDLASSLGRLGRRDEAKAELMRAVESSRAAGDAETLREAGELLRKAGG